MTDAGVPVRPALPQEIHAATREAHLSLNRLITARLLLCLPPHASNPILYATGMALFGQIFIAFERTWKTQIEKGHHDRRITLLLSGIYMPSLSRSARLERDLLLLDMVIPGEPLWVSHKTDGRLLKWRRRIETSINLKPHTVFAYAWVMYMALFNGGRWIRSQLKRPGHDFWTYPGSPKDTENDTPIACLSFWDFEGDQDGEDIKVDFKARFNATAEKLTDDERQDVVEEAIGIFQICKEMSDELDQRALIAKWVNFPPPGTLLAYLLAFVATLLGVYFSLSTVLEGMPGSWQFLDRTE